LSTALCDASALRSGPKGPERRYLHSRLHSLADYQPEQLLDIILKIAPGGIFGIDAEGHCMFVNDSAASMLGYAPELLLGAPILTLIQVASDESRLVRADGSSFPASLLSYPWVQAGGAIYVFQELTETLRRERELREATRRHRELFDYVTSGIFQTSPEGELLAVNPALIELLGFESEQELRAIDVSHLYVHPQLRKQYTEVLERDGFLRNAVLTLRRKDGQVIRVVENGRTVRGEDGRVLYYEGTLNLLTESPLPPNHGVSGGFDILGIAVRLNSEEPQCQS
jgi:PAS domain S-box-containing protein